MKIVYVARKFLEGFAYQDNELADMHTRLGHEVTVITSQRRVKSYLGKKNHQGSRLFVCHLNIK